MADLIFDYAKKHLPKKAYNKLLFGTFFSDQKFYPDSISRMYSDTPQNRKIVDLIKQGKSIDEAFELAYPQKELTPLTPEEYKGSEDALNWAARTYLVAAIGSLATLVYWGLQVFGGRD